ncbi:alkaline phosphatase family protein [Niabella terrae]
MNLRLTKYLPLIVLCLTGKLQAGAQPKASNENKTLVIFFDGLRPDYITKTAMPNLYAFKQQGSYGNHHHSVFPTVTRLNAASLATGSYPDTHGIMGNTIFFPQISTNKTLNTGDAKDLRKVAAATDGQLLTAPSLGEILAANGRDLMVFSSGSTGQALLQNHKVKGKGIINSEMILPASLAQQVRNELGAPPAKEAPNEDRHRWVTDAFLKYGLAKDGPQVCTVWFSDPDHAGHSHGMGSPEARKAIRAVDHEFGRILTALTQRGLRDSYNIIISADHGFVTYIGQQTLSSFLIAKGFKKDKSSDDVVVAGGAIYVKSKDQQLIRQIVEALQQESWVGAIFTRAVSKGNNKGWVPGTLSFDAVHWNHPTRAADILVDRNWNMDRNEQGYEGAGFSKGVAGHGGLSPYETSIPLIVSGPAFTSARVSELPTSNVDIAPTLLALYQIPAPASMEGRVMRELMKNQKTPKIKPIAETIKTQATGKWGTYELELKQTRYGSYRYVDNARVHRKF